MLIQVNDTKSQSDIKKKLVLTVFKSSRMTTHFELSLKIAFVINMNKTTPALYCGILLKQMSLLIIIIFPIDTEQFCYFNLNILKIYCN